MREGLDGTLEASATEFKTDPIKRIFAAQP